MIILLELSLKCTFTNLFFFLLPVSEVSLTEMCAPFSTAEILNLDRVGTFQKAFKNPCAFM